jgi:hypothetical protein
VVADPAEVLLDLLLPHAAMASAAPAISAHRRAPTTRRLDVSVIESSPLNVSDDHALPGRRDPSSHRGPWPSVRRL